MLAIANLHKRYGNVKVLSDISLRVADDEFVCLLGPSGCGKTTLLRIIAGLEDYQQGTIQFAGRDLNDTPARARGFGIVFQSYSLFPGMTAAQNIGYGLTIRHRPREEINAKVAELLALTSITPLAGRYPHELSGGQQQRVAIARALAVEPSLLLLDEPLSALDARVRLELRGEIRQLQRRLRIPTIMVTHDQEEALSMADKIVCMNAGCIEQTGTPHELYEQPASHFVAGFIGTNNFFDVEEAQTLFGATPTAASPTAQFSVRPEALHVQQDGNGQAVVEDVVFLGKTNQVQLRWRDRLLWAECRPADPLAIGDRVHLALRRDDPHHTPGAQWVNA